MKDKLGQEILIGNIIAYGHALGRCAGLRIGRVLDLKEMPGKYVKEKLEYRITVQGIDDDWSHEPPKLNERKGTLQYPDRVIVLRLSQVPDKYKKLLCV